MAPFSKGTCTFLIGASLAMVYVRLTFTFERKKGNLFSFLEVLECDNMSSENPEKRKIGQSLYTLDLISTGLLVSYITIKYHLE